MKTREISTATESEMSQLDLEQITAGQNKLSGDQKRKFQTAGVLALGGAAGGLGLGLGLGLL